MRAQNLTKRYGDVVAVDGVTLDFAPGVHCFAGPNGSGKTTLLRCLAGLTRLTSGSVEVPDDVNYAFQTPSVYHDLTVADNLAVFAGFSDEPREWRADLEDRLGLTPMLDRSASALSDGYRKRLDLALSLLDRPDTLVLDEPLADLDPATRDAIVDTIEAYATDDRYVLVSTHNLDRFDGLADRLTVMSLGRVVADVTREEWSDPETAYERALCEHESG
ncbi:ABC transporter ATP-binding protein [Salarchaeum sp. JOR-1]|uniref:ABC transporter ATP-binding protein n=1 Tax=Salarchaeum sp. JOR-1 TaxID=2599399 RepID=UPI001198B493|nr:ABC transporter ATP-binding protein [Salarchaeum sp. JOR-1]QDX41559.1 ABC transporter ATP-binding protein [Salarchaeum sp. JOR-1]